MKRKIMLKLSVFAVLLVVGVACQKEDFLVTDETAGQEKKNEYTINEYTSLESLSSEITNFIDKANIDALTRKTADSSFSVTFDRILEVQHGQVTTYSFRINSNGLPKNVVENMVLEKSGDTLRAYLIRYHFSERYMKSLAQGSYIPFEGSVNRTAYFTDLETLIEFRTKNKDSFPSPKKVASGTWECYNITIIIRVTCASGSHLPDDDNCYLTGENRAYDIIDTVRECQYIPILTWGQQQTVDWIDGGPGSGIPAVNMDVRVIDQFTNPCASGILTQLREGLNFKNFLANHNLAGNTRLNLAEEIIDLFEGCSSIDVTFSNEKLSGGRNGVTQGNRIKIDDNYLRTATTLAITRTMIHEMLHAYLEAKYKMSIHFNSVEFRDLMIQYAKEKGLSIEGDAERFHHEFMGGYVNAMAISLQEWDKRYGSGTDLGFEYYKALSFGGLFQMDEFGKITTETDAFKALVPKKDRQAIADKINNEQKSNRNAKGKKCK